MEVMLILGYAALFCSVIGSCVVAWNNKYSLLAYVPLWVFANSGFIAILLYADFQITRCVFFVAYCVLLYNALWSFWFKLRHYNENKHIRNLFKSDKKLIYIAGKLNDDACGYIQNVHEMINYAESIRMVGCSVAVPCNDLIHGLVIGCHEYKDYFENNVEIMKRCDAVALVPGWKSSEGTKREILIAEKIGIPILYDYLEAEVFILGGKV
jgi:hypothetical protein